MTTSFQILKCNKVKVILHYFDEQKEDIVKFIEIDEKGLWLGVLETIDEWDIKHSINTEWLGNADLIEVFNAESNRMIAHFMARHLISIFFFEKEGYKILSLTETDLVNV